MYCCWNTSFNSRFRPRIVFIEVQFVKENLGSLWTDLHPNGEFWICPVNLTCPFVQPTGQSILVNPISSWLILSNSCEVTVLLIVVSLCFIFITIPSSPEAEGFETIQMVAQYLISHQWSCFITGRPGLAGGSCSWIFDLFPSRDEQHSQDMF